MKRTEINIFKDLNIDINKYPEEFVNYCLTNELKFPRLTTKNGKALCAMLHTPTKYWTRNSSNAFIQKYKIQTNDSIQLFNKHSQWGIATSIEKGKNYILYPYQLSNKNLMRKNFKFDGDEDQKNTAINNIKSEIKGDYIDIPNNQWELGHKNPDSTDNTNNNLVLQPPIQGKYRDNYIFIDTLTKIPTPKKIISMYNNGYCPFIKSQLKEFRDWLNTLELD
tara:strand:- start:5218 stop:5883 length:666 start_codon:yes stop_codon:yes gene_type:complete